MTFTFVPPIFVPLQPTTVWKGKAGDRESVSGLESCSGGTKLGNTVPKPQQYNSSQYRDIIIAVNYLHNWILKICSEQHIKYIL